MRRKAIKPVYWLSVSITSSGIAAIVVALSLVGNSADDQYDALLKMMGTNDVITRDAINLARQWNDVSAGQMIILRESRWHVEFRDDEAGYDLIKPTQISLAELRRELPDWGACELSDFLNAFSRGFALADESERPDALRFLCRSVNKDDYLLCRQVARILPAQESLAKLKEMLERNRNSRVQYLGFIYDSLATIDDPMSVGVLSSEWDWLVATNASDKAMSGDSGDYGIVATDCLHALGRLGVTSRYMVYIDFFRNHPDRRVRERVQYYNENGGFASPCYGAGAAENLDTHH